MSRNEHLVILIDDDVISNILTADTITGIYPVDKVLAFTDPAEGMQKVIDCLNNLSFLSSTSEGAPIVSGLTIIPA